MVPGNDFTGLACSKVVSSEKQQTPSGVACVNQIISIRHKVSDKSVKKKNLGIAISKFSFPRC